MERSDKRLLRECARVAKRRVSDFTAQNLTNMAWAFATVCQSDASLFGTLARSAAQHVRDFNALALANAAWAFATAG